MQYRQCGDAEREQIRHKAQALVRLDSQPAYIFRELLHYLAQRRVMLPGYSFLQEVISQAIEQEQQRLSTLLARYLDAKQRQSLRNLLLGDEDESATRITQLKRLPRHFGQHEIAQELVRGGWLRPLYRAASRVLLLLEISNESIKSYAALVTYYRVFQLKQQRAERVDVYLLCFVYHRYQRHQDILIDVFRYHVHDYLETTRTAARQVLCQRSLDYMRHLPKVGRVLRLLGDAQQVSHQATVKELRQHVYGILGQQQLAYLARQLADSEQLNERVLRWREVDTLAGRFKGRLRPIVRSLSLDAASVQVISSAITSPTCPSSSTCCWAMLCITTTRE